MLAIYSLHVASQQQLPHPRRCLQTFFGCLLPHQEDNSEHKLRNIVLEVLNRLPHNEVLRPMVPELMNLVLSSLLAENEDNGYICLRILFDLHKNFRPSLVKEVQPFLDFVAEVRVVTLPVCCWVVITIVGSATQSCIVFPMVLVLEVPGWSLETMVFSGLSFFRNGGSIPLCKRGSFRIAFSTCLQCSEIICLWCCCLGGDWDQ